MASTAQNNQMVFQQKSRAQIHRLRDRVEIHAHNALRFREKQHQASSSITLLEQNNSNLRGLDMGRTVGYLIMVFALLVVYCVDYVLFHALISDLTKRFLSTSIWLISLFCLLLPAAIIGIELYIATQRVFALNDQVRYNISRPYWLWTMIGVILSLVMTSLVVSTFLASQPSVMTHKLETILTWKLVGLACLAFVAHSAVIFGGAHAHEAKSYFLFHLVRLFRQFQVRLNRRRFDESSLQTSSAMSQYLFLLGQYNETHNPKINGGPFDSETTAFVNQIFPYPVIQAQGEGGSDMNHRSSGQTPPEPQPEVTHEHSSPDNGDGNLTPEFYDSIIRQVKDGDSEVRS